MTQSVRCEDSVFRTGAESFCFVLPATDAVGANALKSRFIPNLEELGLSPDGAALEVESRFSIQTPDLHSCADAEHVLRTGMAREAVTVTPFECAPAVLHGVDPLDIERALTLLEQGEHDVVRDHLPALIERLRPLLNLAGLKANDHSDSMSLAGNES